MEDNYHIHWTIVISHKKVLAALDKNLASNFSPLNMEALLSSSKEIPLARLQTSFAKSAMAGSIGDKNNKVNNL